MSVVLSDAPPVSVPFVATDRCDRCPAAASVRVFIRTQTVDSYLEFCGHHFNANKEALVSVMWHVDDQRPA